MTADRPSRARCLGMAAIGLAAFLSMGAPGAQAANRSWNNAVSGSASTASNWSPAIAPTYLDTALLYANGTYTISWASPQDTLFALYGYGTPTNSVTGTLGVRTTFQVVSGDLGIGVGSIRANQVVVGADGATGTLRVTGALAANGSVISASTTSPLILAGAGSFANGYDRANVYLTGGGTLLGNGAIETSRSTFTSTHVYVSGYRNLFGSTYRSTLGTLSTAGGGGRGDVVLGAGGGSSSNTTVEVFDGGALDVKGALYVGRGGGGILEVYETVANTNPRAYVYGDVWVGDDLTASVARSGNVFIDGGTVLFGGALRIGDPNYTSGTSGAGLVRITGGKTVLGGPILMSSALGGTLELSGGSLRLLSGTSEIRQDPALNVSSSIGSPAMIVNGTAIAHPYPTLSDPVALGVGRGGAGLLRVCGPNARMDAQGAVTIADSIGGAGIVEVDTSGVLSTNDETLTIGPGGQLSITNGGIVTTGAAPIVCDGSILLDGASLLAGTGALNAAATLQGNGFVHGVWESHGAISVPSGEMSFDLELRNVGGTISGGGTVAVATALYASGAAGVSVSAFGHLYPHDYLPVAAPLGSAPVSPVRAAALSSARPVRASGVPEAALGHLHLSGDLTLGSSSTTSIRIGSAALGQRDTLEADGTAAIDGTLELTSIAGDPPAPGDTITVLEAGAVTGTFSAVTLDGMDPGGDVQVLYEPANVKVVFAPSTAVDDPTRPGIPATLRFSALRQRGTTEFVLDLPAAAHVRISVYDVGGREVARLADDTYASGGRFEFPVPRMASGMYFGRAEIEAKGSRVVKTARVAMLR